MERRLDLVQNILLILTVDYNGNFMNGKRHGCGSSYDRNGHLLYEGEWRCGKNDNFEDVIVIEKLTEKDCLEFHDLMKELVIGENFFNEWTDDLVIENYPNLEKLTIKKGSLKNLKSLKICNNPKFRTLKTGMNAFDNVETLIFDSILLFNNTTVDLPSFKSFSLSKKSFSQL